MVRAGIRIPAVVAAASAGLMLAAPAPAQVYKYVDDDGVIVLTDRKPDPARYPDARNVGCYGICIRGVDWNATPLKTEPYRDEVFAASEMFGVDAALVRAIMHAESWFNPNAVSAVGAQGLMQLMPATQARFGVSDPFDPVENISAGVAYLAELLGRFGHDWELAVAAYNAGENAVEQHGGVPPFAETREYLRRVRILRQRYR
ncbi:MAG: lytic transglycosylase domain-containing protein [Wenzhouxiangellaceae bacterium]|nr:lytic transglycosylase domain-containing protein [Wenzhouxiangellaceae bacterium]